MYKFICQKVEGEIAHDFVLATHQGVNYKNWYNGEKTFDIEFVEFEDMLNMKGVHKGCIPVGTVEFVEEFYKKFHDMQNILPIGIPRSLLNYANRQIVFGDETEPLLWNAFCKSTDKTKGYTEIVDITTKLPKGNYMFSEIIEIESEWRCFVYQGKLLGVHNYINSTDINYYPDIETINQMIRTYAQSESPLPAYTLDVGVNETGTFIIEMHDFYSCGLYGFRDFNNIINMLQASHNYKMVINGR